MNRRPLPFKQAENEIRTRDLPLTMGMLYQLSYLGINGMALHQIGLHRPDFYTEKCVGREGFEPPKARGRQIYSLLRLSAPPPTLLRSLF